MLASLRCRSRGWRNPNRIPRCIDNVYRVGYDRFITLVSSLASPVGPPVVDLCGAAAPPVFPNAGRQHAHGRTVGLQGARSRNRLLTVQDYNRVVLDRGSRSVPDLFTHYVAVGREGGRPVGSGLHLDRREAPPCSDRCPVLRRLVPSLEES